MLLLLMLMTFVLTNGSLGDLMLLDDGHDANDSHSLDRVVGGRPVSINNFPWQVAIGYGSSKADYVHFCGGAMIHPLWLLTAAHCIFFGDRPSDAPKYVIRSGTDHLGKLDMGAWTRAAHVIVMRSGPQAYDAETFRNDIALIRTQHPMVGLPVPLPPHQSDSFIGRDVLVSGFGLVHHEHQKSSEQLMYIPALVTDGQTCAKDFKHWFVHTTNMCLSHEAGKSACRGDSGGPVVLNDRKPLLVGLVSYGYKKCGVGTTPEVPTRVSAFLPFIHHYINQ